MTEEGNQVKHGRSRSNVKEEGGKMSAPRRRGPTLPGDHLLLLVGGVAAAAQVLVGRGQEVQTVVFEVLVDERKKHLRDDDDERFTGGFRLPRHTWWSWVGLTLAKNLISCS